MQHLSSVLQPPVLQTGVPKGSPGDPVLWSRVKVPSWAPVKFHCPEHPLTKRVRRHAPEFIPPLGDGDVVVLELQDTDAFRRSARMVGEQTRLLLDASLRETGAVLLRGLLPMLAESACAFVDGLGFTKQHYEPFGGRRKKLLTLDMATNISADMYLDLHNEMVYNPNPSSKIGLICLEPAPRGGESVLGSTRLITAGIPGDVVDRFANNGGILYRRFYSCAGEMREGVVKRLAEMRAEGVISDEAQVEKWDLSKLRAGFPLGTWQERVGSSDPLECTQFWRGLGCEVAWQEDGSVLVWNVKPAVDAHPLTGERLWFNLAVEASPSFTYPNGNDFEDDVLDHIAKARAASMRGVPLAAGDVLFLDNWLWLHGRMPYEGPRTMATLITADW